MNLSKNNRGWGNLGFLLFILLLVVILYFGFRIAPFYYNFYEIQGTMAAQAAKASEFTDDEIRREIMQRIKKLEIPIEEPEDLKINRYNGKIIIDLHYTELLDLDLGESYQYDLWEFEFTPHAEHKL